MSLLRAILFSILIIQWAVLPTQSTPLLSLDLKTPTHQFGETGSAFRSHADDSNVDNQPAKGIDSDSVVFTIEPETPHLANNGKSDEKASGRPRRVDESMSREPRAVLSVNDVPKETDQLWNVENYTIERKNIKKWHWKLISKNRNNPKKPSVPGVPERH